MQTLIIFLFISIIIYLYLIFYHKIDVNNILDVMHTAFIRQFIFELIPFIILFGAREMHFVNVASAPEFFNSVIGRSMIGMIAFTFVSYVLVSATPQKPNPININTADHDDLDDHDITDKESTNEKFSSKINKKYTRIKPNANDQQLIKYSLI
jgi:hypothetical protein